MAFLDDCTGTPGQLLDARTGWSIKGVDGAYNFQITATGTTINSNVAGGGAGNTAYICTNQGAADHRVQAKLASLIAAALNLVCVRLVDNNNAVGWRLAGTGSQGLRMTKLVAGVYTDQTAGTSPSMQGVIGDSYRVDVTVDQYSLWYDPGSTGSYTQSGSDQTVSNAEISTAETDIGMIAGGLYTTQYDDFFAEALGGGVTIPAGTLGLMGVGI